MWLLVGGWKIGAAPRAEGEQVGVVFAVPDQKLVLNEIELALEGGVEAIDHVLEQAFDQGENLLIAAHALVEGHAARVVDQAAWIGPGQANDAPQLALSDAPILLEHALAQLLGRRSDRLRLGQNAMRLARWVEQPLLVGQDDLAGRGGQGMGAQQRLRVQVADFKVVLEHAHQDTAADLGRARGVAAVFDLHATVFADRPLDSLKYWKASMDNSFRYGRFS